MILVERVENVPLDFLIDSPEGGAFYRAYARARVPGFELGCLIVKREGQAVATAPFFTMKLPLNTMMPPGLLKKLLGGLALRIALVGHPSADIGHIEGEQSAEVLEAINSELRKLAPLVSYKGFDGNLALKNFNKVVGLPVPVLEVSPDYWARLKHKVRTDLKRKLKASAGLRLAEVDGLPPEHLLRVHELYRQTCDNAPIQFEQLNVEYFRESASSSKYLFYFEGDTMIGFHQLMCSEEIMYCKYIGMDYGKSQHYKLYFALMLQAVNICIRDGIRKIDFGVTSYAFKRHVGSEMHPTFNYFQHRSAFVNAILKRLSFLLEPSDSELR
ncbi:GNAT family N-acetyltransferase [Variovorax sp. YR216]|uniref:GNAT family N-acetyltransferase n=1 Tax=Variovorax sp. YR216 TaxID=1882828 RepID=UPI0008946280|nr:GNAT family N-acetyltransferase [Variovorax sp. YR216]SEA41706.1 Acetyltransferase (GNAT) domain-containing protein [Variovorax sp. YR216]